MSERNEHLKAVLREVGGVSAKPSQPSRTITAFGPVGVMGDVVGDNNVVFNAPQIRVRVSVKPGADHISNKQAARLKELVGIIAGRGRRSFGSVYGDLFRHLGGGHPLVPSYRLIPVEMFDKAETFLVDWAERLREERRSKIK